MRMLHVISSVDARGGGPIEGVKQLSSAMHVVDGSLEVVSLDDPAASCLQGLPMPVHAVGPGLGKYGYSRHLVPWLKRHAREYDGVIVNGIWQYHSLATWRALHGTGVPYFLFTHGMLDPWFKQAYPLKHLKKWLYWTLAEHRVLRDARAVIFTCEEERRLARESFRRYAAREAVVAYGTSAGPQDHHALRARFLESHPQLRRLRLLLFISRIHEKKGCDLLIEAFARVAAAHPDLHLVMAGPDQTNWRPALEALAAARGVASRITWTGMLQGKDKWAAYYAADAMVLPSHQENFGFVVVEALTCGIPVLISDKVNIWREVEADGAALVEADTMEGTERLLTRWLATDEAARLRMRAQARECFDRRFTSTAMAASLAAIIRGAPPRDEAAA
jgi:glycosyltransferase involved in cell wall biosynthesis